jgi:hypothetical protein
MKKLLTPIALFLSIAFVYAAEKGTWTGWISDSKCGANGAKEGHVDCAKKCVKEGAAPVVVIDKKVYTITNPEKATDFLGEKVSVTGTITDDKIEIEKISK